MMARLTGEQSIDQQQKMNIGDAQNSQKMDLKLVTITQI